MTRHQFFEDIKKQFIQGKPIMVSDSSDRENEADFIFPAEIITSKIVNFMITHGKGLLCVAMCTKLVAHFDLKPITGKNTTKFTTNFLTPVDFIWPQLTTGICAKERAKTIQALTNTKLKSTHFNAPGHVFTLGAHPQGLLGRQGHTEAGVEIALGTGFEGASAIIEILDHQGSNQNPKYLQTIQTNFNLKWINIQQILDLTP